MDNAVDMEGVDALIVGGGLAGGLLALALAERAGWRVGLLEEGKRLGGNHTWSFHATDIPADGWPFIEELVGRRWEGYDVRFPDGDRRLAGGYLSIASDHFAEVVERRLRAQGAALWFESPAAALTAREVTLADGRVLRASVVFDARGPVPAASVPAADATDGDDGGGGAKARPAGCGYQKFVGLEVELEEDAPLEQPLLMDACVPQLDGFRFFYLLPFGPRRLLVEDTVYSNDPALDRVDMHGRILGYLRDRGYRVARVLREERGVLPLPWQREPVAEVDEGGWGRWGCASPVRRLAPPADAGALVVGYRGGWFHPVTGYSLPSAIRLALGLASAVSPSSSSGPLRGDAAARALAAAARELWRHHDAQASVGRLLLRLMFTAVALEERWRLLARFYTLPADTIARFYALRMTAADRIRLLVGRPPRGLSWRAAFFPKEET